jgi:hypothetical protein
LEKELIRILMAGQAVAFRVKNKKLSRLIRSRYRGYISNRAQSGLSIECTFSHQKCSSYQRVRLRHVTASTRRCLRYDFDCLWDEKSGRARLWPSLYSFDAMLRVLLASRLVGRFGLLLHAAAVVRQNAAVVFAGPSGSGKTTISRLSGARRVLNDEITAVTIDNNNSVCAWGTPFWGEMGSGPANRRPHRVQSVFFLNQGLFSKRINLPRHKAVGKFLRCVCLFGTSEQESQAALQTCIRILSSVDFADLYFEKKPLDWSVLIKKT